jgi:hypothetical protein
MADFVSVANMALGRIGEPYRISVESEDSHPARTIRTEWDNARRAVLRRGKFNFAMTRAALTAQAATDPNYVTPFPFDSRFPVPPDCLRVVELYDATGCLLSVYKYEARAILADGTGPLTLVYGRDVTEIGDWDDLSIQALVARIGYAIADTLAGDRGRKQDCWAEFQRLSKDTGGVDAKEDPPEQAYDSSWVTSRFAGPLGGPPNVG